MNLNAILDQKIDDLFLDKLHAELERKVSRQVTKKISDNIWSKRKMNVFHEVEIWFKYMIGRI
jgi:ubiquitin C-terminal hydrolase